MIRITSLKILASLLLLLFCNACSKDSEQQTASDKPTSQPVANAEPQEHTPSMPVHVDPLDAGRGAAMHRGKDPHSSLNPEQHIQVALQHQAEGRIPQSLAVLNKAIVGFPETAELYDVRATILLAVNKTYEALADIEQAVKLAPQNPVYLVNRSQVYLKFERTDDAMTDLNRAVELNADLLPARFNRGSLLAYQGRYQQAKADFDHCIMLDPHLPGPYFNRGSVLHAMGDRKEAIADIERFIQVSKRDDWKQSGEDLLKVWRGEK